MLVATEVRVGNIVRIDGKIEKVVAQEIKGTGKFGKTVHLRLRNVEDGNLSEKSLRAEEKVEDVEFRRIKMQYLYRDGDQFVFMNMESYEQFVISQRIVGRQEVFLRENSEIDVDFVEGKAVSIDFPKVVELKVISAPPGTKGGNDSTYKEVELENGIKTLVPQFVKEGELIRIATEDFKYQERVSTKSL